MSDDIKEAARAAIFKLAAPIPLTANETRIFNFAFIAGAIWQQEAEIKRMDEKLERLK